MVIDLLKNHASCYPNQENVFAAKQKQILDQLEKEDPETELNLIWLYELLFNLLLTINILNAIMYGHKAMDP